MDYHSLKFIIWAAGLGLLSAASLPLGSAIGLRTSPRPPHLSAFMAFGAGALIAALAVELVAPTVLAITATESHGQAAIDLIALVIGALCGGIFFIVLDQIVNAHGGFLRKTVGSIGYFRVAEKKRRKVLIEKLAQFPFLQNIPAEHINTLISLVRPVTYNDGEIIAREGEEFHDLVFILEGTVSISGIDGYKGEMGPSEVAGFIPLVMNLPSPGTGEAKGVLKGLALSRAGFEKLRELSPEFDEACKNTTEERLEMLARHVSEHTEQAMRWKDEATHALRVGAEIPSADQLRRAKAKHKGAGLAIWLGILLDGIPEGFVIGVGLFVLLQAGTLSVGDLHFRDIIPFTLIAGLFLSNFPEALSSSVNMRLQGWGKRKIFMMWLSLMVITGIVSGCGYLMAESLSHTALISAEGLAAGAMLTMIAAAMIPEAVHMGNANLVGISTLIGFLSAILFKLLESPGAFGI